MYAPLGVDSDSSGEETTPPTPAPPRPPKPQFKFKSLFASTKKLEARVPRRAEELKKDEQKEPPTLEKKRVRIFARDLLSRQKGSKTEESLTMTRGARVEPDPTYAEKIKQDDKDKLEPVRSTEQAAINPVASEVLVLLRQLVAESHATNKNTDSEPKADSANQEMNEEFSTNEADPEKKVDLPAPEVITVTDRKDEKPIDAKPIQEAPALQYNATSHLPLQDPAREQHHLVDNYFASFGPPLANNIRLPDTSVNRPCHQQLPHMVSPYGCYLQLPCRYPWMTYPPGPQWWSLGYHSSSDVQNTATKLSSPAHPTLVGPVILESCISPLKTYVQKYEAVCNQALKSYKGEGPEQGERTRRNEEARSAERRLRQAIRALQDTELETGDDSDSNDPRSSERKEIRGGQNELSKKTNSPLKTEHAGHEGKSDTTPAADNTAKFTPTPYSTVSNESTALKALETYVLEYRQNHNRAIKKYKTSENGDERNRMKTTVKKTEGKLRIAMQALDTAKRDQGGLANGKNEEEVQQRPDNDKGRVIDDVQETHLPSAEKEALVEKKFNKGKRRAVNAKLKAEEARRIKENKGEGQFFQTMPMDIARPVQEPVFDVLMDESVVGNEDKDEPYLPDHSLGDQRFPNISHSAVDIAIQCQDEKPTKKPLIETKSPEVLPPAPFPRLYDKPLPENITSEQDKAIKHYKIKYAAIAKALSGASLMHEEKLEMMKEADRVEKKIKALMDEVEVNKQGRKAKDVIKEARGSITKQISDKKDVEAAASVPQHEGGAHSKASSPPSSFVTETNDAPEAISITDKGKLLVQCKSKYSKLTKFIKEDDLTAHDKQLHIKEADKLKSKVKGLKIEIESSQAAVVGEEEMKIIKGDGDPPVNEERDQMEMVDTEAFLKLFKVKHSKLAKAAKDDTVEDDTRRKRKAKAERQGLVAQIMMETMNKGESECKGQAAVDEAEGDPKSGKDNSGLKKQAQILSQGVSLKKVERAIWQGKEERPTEEIKNLTTEKKEPRQCPPSDCEIDPCGKKWLPWQVTSSKTPVNNNATRSEPASAILSKDRHFTQPEPIKPIASHKSAINALNISHSPLKPTQMTQDDPDDNFSCKRSPAAITKVIGNSPKASRQVSLTSSGHRPPPLTIPLQRNEWVDSDTSSSQIVAFDLPSFSHDHQSERDQESSPSEYSQSSAYSFSSMISDSTVKSDRLVLRLLAQTDSGPMPVHHDTRDGVNH